MEMRTLQNDTQDNAPQGAAKPEQTARRRVLLRPWLTVGAAVVMCVCVALTWRHQSRMERAEALNLRGLELHDLEKYPAAIAAYSQAIRLDPKLAQAYNNRAASYHAAGNSERALEDYARALELAPDQAVIWFNRGSTFDDLGEYNRALFDYDEAIRLDSKYADAYHNRAVTLRRKGKLEQANADFARAKELRAAEE